jgi:membrane protein
MAASLPNTPLGWLMRVRQLVREILALTVSPKPVINRLRTAVHFFVLIWQGFVGNRCPIRAAALSYTTLLALVPILVVVLSISKNFLHENNSEVLSLFMNRVITAVAPQLEVMPMDEKEIAPAGSSVDPDEEPVVPPKARQETVNHLQEYIDHINTGALGTVGTIFLVFVGIRLLITIEQTFNDIWNVRQGRSLWRKIVYYWTTVTLGPLLLILAMYWTGRTEFTLTGHTGVEKFFFQAISLLVLWLGFSLMYLLLPNTAVQPRAALAGGIFAGTLWQLNSLLSTLYVSRVVTYSRIYGTLGIIPVLLVGLYFSWLIILLGAQVSYAVQNVHRYMQQLLADRIDQRGRESFACRTVLVVCETFSRGQPPLTGEQIADQIGAPAQWLSEVIDRLKDRGLLTFAAGEKPGIIPARPPESITIADVLHAVRTSPTATGDQPLPDPSDMDKLLADLHSAERGCASNLRFSDLVGPRTS